MCSYELNKVNKIFGRDIILHFLQFLCVKVELTLGF